ncbi:MAG TPA: ATP-binding protein [Flavisolibacter sp.]|nr:ATP-binding protein [Flavisolibacter sp.]
MLSIQGNHSPLPLLFGESFLDHHVGQIMQDPHFAIIELIANAWDAGATKVEIHYPLNEGEYLSIVDNGSGMTENEFKQRWSNLNYNRLHQQGRDVLFPKGKGNRHRLAFGKNGVGRHAMFCFCNEYTVETTRDGICTVAKVVRSRGNYPFEVTIEEVKKKTGHGTHIRGIASRNISLREKSVCDLIGSKFIADPEFQISVNSSRVLFTDFKDKANVKDLEIDNVGKVIIYRLEGEKQRTSQLHGVAWWVYNRLVGVASWEGINGRLIDGRNPIAKKYIYIIEADHLKPFVKADWSSFNSCVEVNLTKQEVFDYINDDLSLLLAESRKERKIEAFNNNSEILSSLPKLVQDDVAEVIDQLQQECPTFGMNELESTVKILALMEKGRSGYSLLEKLSKFDYDDIDGLDTILEEWSVNDIRKVQKELSWRLQLITELEKLVDNSAADELHDLQPLFERGLWIFGPEFESISFTSNNTLSTIIKKHFGEKAISNQRKRPDFIVFPDSSIGVYSRDSFNDNHEIDGIDSVVIIELKKGGFEISHDEKDQAMKYAREIKRSGKLNKETSITCYVLGSIVSADAEEKSVEGSITVIPYRYNTIVNRAKARTFNLLHKLEKYSNDIEMTDIGTLPTLFKVV